MGRPRWATPKQTEFLLEATLNLEREKHGGGLASYYESTALQFLKKWPARPTTEDLETEEHGKNPQTLADDRRKMVRLRFPPV